MPRDDWTMGLLFDQGAYRGEVPDEQWPPSPPAPQPKPPTEFSDYLNALPQLVPDRLISPPESPAGAIYGAIGHTGGAVVQGVGHAIGDIADVRGYQKNPHEPGTEEWQFAENVKADKAPQWAAETAMTLAGAGAPAAVKGAAGIFGGRLSATADLKALSRAEAMATAGHDAQKIWDATGWFQGADKKWRYEIPDEFSKMRTSVPKLGAVTPLSRHFSHDALFAAYPKLGKLDTQAISPRTAEVLNLKAGYSPAVGFMYNPADKSIGAREMLLHELQHGVQRIEDFAKGGGPKGPGRAAYEAYRRLAGEVEARNVQTRMDYGAGQRKAAPWITQEYPYKIQGLEFYSFPRRSPKSKMMGETAALDGYD